MLRLILAGRGERRSARRTPLVPTVGQPLRRRVLGRDPVGLLFVLPAVALFMAVGLVPIIASGAISLTKWNGLSEPEFVGIRNYESFLWGSSSLTRLFWEALSHNAFLGVMVTAGVLTVSLPLAAGLHGIVRGRSFFRSTLLLPMVTAGIAVYFTWSFLYSPFGPINSMLELVGLGEFAPPRGWLGDPVTALPALGLVLIWTSIPLATLLYLAGLQAIDPNLYEAAALDGASWLQRVRLISWPLLRPITVIIVTLNLVAILQSYEMVYLMTNGGPTNHTTVVGLLAFNLAFGTIGGMGGQLGTASAIGWTMFVILAGITWIMTRVLRPRVES